MQKRISEASVLKAILEYLQFKGVYAWRMNLGPLYIKGKPCKNPNAGISDILAIGKNGRFIAIEVKAPGKECTASKAQAAFLLDVIDAGGIGIIASTVYEVERVLTWEGGV